MNSRRRNLALLLVVALLALGYVLYRNHEDADHVSRIAELLRDGKLAQSGPAACCVDTSPTLKGDPDHPGKSSIWVESRLYFSLGPADDLSKGVSDKFWGIFLDLEVTPRFPSGLSVQDVYGQWQGKGEKTPARIRTKVLIIDYPATPDNDARIEAIRAAWKQRTGDQSVLRVTQAATVSF